MLTTGYAAEKSEVTWICIALCHATSLKCSNMDNV